MERVRIGIGDLRDNLERHIAAVRDGMEIVVTDRGEPVAKITGIESASGLARLLREGTARAPSSLRHPVPEGITGTGMVSDLVAEQRR